MNNEKSKVINIEDISMSLNFDDIYNEYFNRVYKFCSYRVNNPEDAKDLASDIFVKIYKNINSFNPNKSNLAVWIFTIARNSLTDYYRKKSRNKLISIDKFKDFFFSEKYVEDNLEEYEEKEYLRKSIRALNEREQKIIAYKFGAELSNKEISEIMEISYENVSVILYRSIRKLKKEMEQYYEK